MQQWRWILWPAVIIAVQQIFFGAPKGAVLGGVVLGLITALVTLGMFLVYRANRVLNFAAGELGLLPGVFAVLIIMESGINWYLGFSVGLIGSVLVGIAAEFIIMRRFFDSPRLVVTVATIGLAQLLGVAAIFMPAWWDTSVQSQRLAPPFDAEFTLGSRVFNANHILVLVLAPLAMAIIGAILRYTRVGIAIRASAEIPTRANLLGIPVKALQSLVWGMATALAFLAVFLRAGVFGIPIGGQLGLLLLLRALAALMLGRMVHLPTMLGSAIALGVLQEGLLWNAEGPAAAEAQMAGITGIVIVVALLTQNSRGIRESLDTSSWQAVGDSSAIDRFYLRIPLVRYLRTGALVAVLALGLFAPGLDFLGTEDVLRISHMFITAIIILSLVVLTGWAGQLSLGQMAFAGVGAVVGAILTNDHNVDLVLAVLIAGVVGAAVSLIIGVPALRLRGTYLAVTSLAFVFITSSYLLNPRFFDWIPDGRIERLPILGRVEWTTSTGVYYVTFVALLIALACVRGVRNSRTGRVLIALRDNEAGVEAYGVSPVRAKLTAFAISGFLAAAGGALLVHHQQSFNVGAYDANFSIGIFTAAVVGGMGSLFGAVLGVAYWSGTFFWLQGTWRLFASGIGILFVLIVAPAGLAGLLQSLRDLVLRQVYGQPDATPIDWIEDDTDAGDPEHHDGQDPDEVLAHLRGDDIPEPVQ